MMIDTERNSWFRFRTITIISGVKRNEYWIGLVLWNEANERYRTGTNGTDIVWSETKRLSDLIRAMPCMKRTNTIGDTDLVHVIGDDNWYGTKYANYTSYYNNNQRGNGTTMTWSKNNNIYETIRQWLIRNEFNVNSYDNKNQLIRNGYRSKMMIESDDRYSIRTIIINSTLVTSLTTMRTI